MKKMLFISILTIFAAALIPAQEQINAQELLSRVDDNEVFDTISYNGRMIIEYQGRRFVKEMDAVARENSDSFIEFTNPEDRGTKYLKQGGRLYVYSPDTEQVMLISGHMLKESMMGSDLSYEDTIENNTLSERYTATLSGSENLNGREAWVLDLQAKKRTESYPRRKLWIDKENNDLLRFELYALSGALLKEYNLIRAELIKGRRFPVESEMKDLLRRDSRTVFIMEDVVLDEPVSDSVFSMRNLQR